MKLAKPDLSPHSDRLWFAIFFFACLLLNCDSKYTPINFQRGFTSPMIFRSDDNYDEFDVKLLFDRSIYRPMYTHICDIMI